MNEQEKQTNERTNEQTNERAKLINIYVKKMLVAYVSILCLR